MSGYEALLDAMILVGGKGNRLQGIVNDRPKPMAEVAGRPFIEWLLLALRFQGVHRVVLCTGHMGQVVEDYFGDIWRWDMEIVYSRDPMPLGTAGALRYALTAVKTNRILVLNGDSYCRFDLPTLLEAHQKNHARVTLRLTPADDCSRYGSVETSQDGAVRAFHEKSSEKRVGLISAGIYLIERDAVATIPEGRVVSIETEFFPSLIGHGLYAVVGDGPFLDIGTPESYEMAEQVLREDLGMLRQREQRLAHAEEHLRASAAIKNEVATQCMDAILGAADLIAGTFRAGNKVLLCGNGGSAADCQHMAAEFVSRLTKDFERPGLPAIALTTDTSFLTAFANDCGFEGVFERQVQTLGKSGDVLIGISTSGNSANVIRAIEAARVVNMRAVVLTGDSGCLAEIADVAISVPSGNTQYIQEAHLAIEHIICELVERQLFGKD